MASVLAQTHPAELFIAALTFACLIDEFFSVMGRVIGIETAE